MRVRTSSCPRRRSAFGGLALAAATTMAAPESLALDPEASVDAGRSAPELFSGWHHPAGRGVLAGYTVVAD